MHNAHYQVRRRFRGDDKAFRDLFEAHFDRLHCFAIVRLGGDEKAAAAAVQAAFFKLVDRGASYLGEAPLLQWLCTICRREIYDLRQRNRRLVSVGVLEETPQVRMAPETLLGSRSSSVHEALEREEVRRRFTVAMIRHSA